MICALAVLRDKERAENGGSPSPLILRCLHVEHGIRAAEESRGDADFVRDLCRSLDIPCKIVSVRRGKIARLAKDKGLGIEAAARFCRQRAWTAEARRIEAGHPGLRVRVLTAHTRDDLLETTLMRILRGAGPAGLAAMPPCRGILLRPLLGLSRADVIHYLEEKKIPHRTDSSNGDIRFFRNRIRARLIPRLDEDFPGWRVSLQALAETQAMTADFLKTEAGRRVSWNVAADGENRRQKRLPQELWTDEAVFFAQDPLIREEALFLGIDLLLSQSAPGGDGFSAPVPAPRRAILRAFCAGGRKAADLGPVKLRRSGGRLFVGPCGPRPAETGFSLLIKEPGLYKLKQVTIELKPGLYTGSQGEGVFSAQLPLVLRRTFKGGWVCETRGKETSVSGEIFTVTVRKNNTGGIDVQQSE
jgi:tRNA(Ile)-lysidine synthase